MIFHSKSLALACIAGLSVTAVGAEFVGSDVPGTDGSAPATPTDNLTRIPQNAYQPPRTGIPFRSIFRDTNAPYTNALRDVRVDPVAQPADTVEARARIDVPDFRGRFPLLQRGFAPENADLKIGPLYFKLRHLSAAVLHSDNVNRDNRNKESDTIGIISIGGQVLAQLTEGFHIAVAGNIAYLPFEGEGGLNGLSLVAPYSFGLAGTPNANAQVAWEPVIFGLPFVIADEFTMGLARFTNDGYDSFELTEGFETDLVDRAGIYSVRAPSPRNFRDSDRDVDTRNDLEFIYYSNEVSISTGGPLPGENVFRFRASHEDIWFEEQGNNLPEQRDRVFLGIESIRKNLRFKPYANYQYIRIEEPVRSIHTIRAGVRGPITDLMNFQGELGYNWNDQRDGSNITWNLAINHTPNPRTRQSLVYQRDYSEFYEELDERVAYRITKVLGPSITSTAYASYHWVEDADELAPDREEFRTGIAFNYYHSPKTSYKLLGQHSNISYDADFGSSTTWRGRFECRHQFLQSLYARLIYQYEQRETDGSSREYNENLLYLSLTWIFD